MDTPHLPTMLDTLSALRVEYADLPAATIAAMLPQLDPETAARVQAMVTECDEREGFPGENAKFLRWGHPRTLDETSTLINLCCSRVDETLFSVDSASGLRSR